MITVLFKMYKRSCTCCLNMQITRQDSRCHDYSRETIVFTSYPVRVCSITNPEWSRSYAGTLYLRGSAWRRDDEILSVDKATIKGIMSSLLWAEPETKERCLL